jgi:hypothetical protein
MPDDPTDRLAGQVDVNSPSFALTLFLRTDAPGDKRRVLDQHPVLLSPGMDQFMEFAIASSRDVPGLAEALEAHRMLLARCRQVGVDQAFAEWAARLPADETTLTAGESVQAPSDELTFTVSLFLQARTGPAKRRLVEQHPELLGSEADMLLAYWLGTAQGRGNDDEARILGAHRHLLLRCRQIGVYAAFAEQGL